jgi:16S rRNA (uracil1498-N3)-methyltransferase
VAHVPRLYLPELAGPGPCTLDGPVARRLATVMRLQPGAAFQVFRGDGKEWRATVAAVARNTVEAEVVELLRDEPRSARTVDLWCGLVRPARFDLVIEKATEAGVDRIRPLLSAYTARGAAPSGGRSERWERLVIEAAEQAGRVYLPTIAPPASYEAFLAVADGARVVADGSGDGWAEVALRLPASGTIHVAVGPEGGWSADEIAAARAARADIARLGPNILRTETAAIAVCVLLCS